MNDSEVTTSDQPAEVADLKRLAALAYEVRVNAADAFVRFIQYADPGAGMTLDRTVIALLRYVLDDVPPPWAVGAARRYLATLPQTPASVDAELDLLNRALRVGWKVDSATAETLVRVWRLGALSEIAEWLDALLDPDQAGE